MGFRDLRRFLGRALLLSAGLNLQCGGTRSRTVRNHYWVMTQASDRPELDECRRLCHQDAEYVERCRIVPRAGSVIARDVVVEHTASWSQSFAQSTEVAVLEEGGGKVR